MAEDIVKRLRAHRQEPTVYLGIFSTGGLLSEAATEIERLRKALNDLREACEYNDFDGIGFGQWAGWEAVNDAREVLGLPRLTEKEFADSYAAYRKAEDERLRHISWNEPDQGGT